MVRRLAAAAGALAAILLPGLLFATPAGASLNGPCHGSGTFTAHPDAPDEIAGFENLTIDPSTTNGPVKIPRAASVNWTGSIDGTPPEDGRAYTGQVTAVLPPVFDPILGDAAGLAELWTWGSKKSTATADSGVEKYKIPSWVPGGAKVVVAGGHSDALGNCTGTVILRLDGSPLSSPVTVVVIVVTAGGVLVMISSSIQR